jgi:hypothetical protein
VAKAQIEKAEVKADLTKERLEIYQVKRLLYMQKEAYLELTCTIANFPQMYTRGTDLSPLLLQKSGIYVKKLFTSISHIILVTLSIIFYLSAGADPRAREISQPGRNGAAAQGAGQYIPGIGNKKHVFKCRHCIAVFFLSCYVSQLTMNQEPYSESVHSI